jgi:chromosome segregation ATPase
MRLLDKERNEHKAQMAVVLGEKQALKSQLNEQQQQLLSLHRDLAQKDEKISALRDEKKFLLRDGKKDKTLAEIQAAIKGLQDQISAETS